MIMKYDIYDYTWLIGILIMAYEIIPIYHWVGFHLLYKTNNQGQLVTVHTIVYLHNILDGLESHYVVVLSEVTSDFRNSVELTEMVFRGLPCHHLKQPQKIGLKP